jgi:threonine dehydrogenase-like Zn-dependent dehydrogenase
VPTPEPGSGEVLVRVQSAGICGSDLHSYRDASRLWKGVEIPFVTGHELAGEVAVLGAGVAGLEVGQRVVVEPRHLVGCGHCRYCYKGDYHLCKERGRVGGKRTGSTGFAEYSLEPVKNVFPLPDHVSIQEASILDVYACGVHAARIVPVDPTKTVVVQGAGPIGLTAMEVYKLVGARKVIVCDVVDSALEFAKKIGADAVVNSARTDAVQAVMDMTEGYGADIVIDAVGGNAPIFNTNIQMAAPGATVGVIGMYGKQQSADVQLAQQKEVGIVFLNSYAMWNGVPEVKISLDYLADGKLKAKDYITHTFPLDRIAEGFAAASNKAESGAIKVVILP